MKRVTDEIGPMLNKLLKKGQGWILRLLNATDHTMTKVLHLFEEKKNQFDKYLIDRGKLVKEIEVKQEEVTLLHEQTRKLNKKHIEQVISLYEKLNIQSSELIHMQQEYFDLERMIEHSNHTINNLSHKKEEAEKERNWLRSEYENLQKILSDNTSKLATIHKEINELKQEQVKNEEVNLIELSHNIQKEIDERNDELARLHEENKKYNEQISEIETELLIKAKEIAKITGDLQKAEAELQKKKSEIGHLQIVISKKNAALKAQQTDYAQMESAFKNKITENEHFIKTADTEINNLKNQLKEKEQEQLRELINTEEEMTTLKRKLTEKQNQLAMERADNGEPYKISAETSDILDQEYKPRFKTLYKNSVFYDEFFLDFYSLVPSDRLRVEAAIANLNNDFDLYIPKVRPRTVQTNIGKILEYPFGHDSTGRIYFRRENGKVNYYRISRTKNGRRKLSQKRVIAWLQRHLT